MCDRDERRKKGEKGRKGRKRKKTYTLASRESTALEVDFS